ncbi:MAG: hypothetical protein QM582_18770 [Micropruina sp.]|uniref:MutS-related protein n=1 Tax=Micropruina sp. TaxID=2737536 RepID=UPI0039E3CA0B
MTTAPLVTRPFDLPDTPPEAALPSLLNPGGRLPDAAAPSDALTDLHLDAVIEAMAPEPFQQAAWRLLPDDPVVVAGRQAVVRDLRRPEIRVAADDFIAAVTDARAAIAAAAGSHYALPAQLRLLAALRRFAESVRGFAGQLAGRRPELAGLGAVADVLAGYLGGPQYAELSDGSATLLADLCGPAATLGVVTDTVWADADGGEPPWGALVQDLFARFAGSPPLGEDRPLARPRRDLNHIEAQAVGLIAQLRPEPFGRLRTFLARPAATVHPELIRLADELRFFLGCLRVVDELAARGVRWCLPRVTPAPGAVDVRGMIDLALALSVPDALPVPNDLRLAAGQREVFVTGPNQGGKTTFARAVGQLAWMAALGLPVPAASATLPLHRPVLTHFPRPDDPARQRGGLAEELARLRDVLRSASPSALVILNELLSTTSVDDALQVSRLALRSFAGIGCRVLWVTFLDDLVSGASGAVSLVGQLAADDPTRPTFEFREQPPAGHAHARFLAARYGLSADDLARRLR